MTVSVSIIIPVYQAEDFLPACLTSVLAQTYPDFEVICVDDGSTDKSASIVQQYAVKDSRIRLMSGANQGVSMARNTGLAMARGDYIAFVDSDDMIHPLFLEKMVQTALRTGADIVSCAYQQVSSDALFSPGTLPMADTERVTHHPFDALVNRQEGYTVMVWGKVFHRSVIGDILFDERLSCGEDYLFVHQVFYQAKKSVTLDTPLLYYRQSPNSIMHKTGTHNKVQAHFMLASRLKKIFADVPMTAKTRRTLDRHIAKMFLKYAFSYPIYDTTAYYQSWEKYAEQLRDYYREGLYCPVCLSLKNKILSHLFLNRRFRLLSWLKGI